MGCTGTDRRCTTCRIAPWPMVGRQALARMVLQRHVQLARSGKVETYLAAMGRKECRSGTGCEQVCGHMILRRLSVNNWQARSKRLGPGLMASAPHHRPRGLLHPRVRKRLDFVSVDNLSVA